MKSFNLNYKAMKTDVYAIVKDKNNLDKYANVVNNGRIDGTYFYVSGLYDNEISVCNKYRQLSEDEQISELEYFLTNRSFEIVTI